MCRISVYFCGCLHPRFESRNNRDPELGECTVQSGNKNFVEPLHRTAVTSLRLI